jgi:hypothetical protein
MKLAKTKLTENHRRSLTSALMMVEQMMFEMKDSLLTSYNTCCLEIEKDVSEKDKNYDLEIINKALEQICKLADKYEIEKRKQSLKRIVNAKKTKSWEILCDMKSRKQKGFGEFPKELTKEYDNDIEELLIIIEKINF